jgi:hypothetical protein
MKELSLEKMENVQGGSACGWAITSLVASGIGIFAAPFTGGISLGLVAFVGFVASAAGAGYSC